MRYVDHGSLLATTHDSMVHYDNPWQAAQVPPPICPKCGSHRTQVVGRSNDGTTLTVRCGVCGERSTVIVGDDNTLGARRRHVA